MTRESHGGRGADPRAESDLPIVLAADPSGIRRAADILVAGGIVAFPTESSFGLAARFDAPRALERLAAIKGRGSHMPFPLIVSDRQEADRLVGGLSGAAADLAQDHWPGPLTLVVRPRVEWPLHSLLSSRLGIGIRWSSHPVATALVGAVGRPITATSANRTGRPAAMTAEQVREIFGSDVDAVLAADSWRQAPSTVAVVWAWGVEVLREGPIVVSMEQRVSRDQILRGRLELIQPVRGYRFSVDALLLAHFGAGILPPAHEPAFVVDLGAGCGVVGLALTRHPLHSSMLHSHQELVSSSKAIRSNRTVEPDETSRSQGSVGPDETNRSQGSVEPDETNRSQGSVEPDETSRSDFRMWALEIQPRLAALARLNGPLNDLDAERYQVIEGDLRQPGDLSAVPAGQVDLVLSNPPYQPVGRGRPSPNAERDRATRQTLATIDEVARAAARLLRPNGRFAVVLPAERLADLFAACTAAGLAPTILRPVHAFREQSARRILVAATKTSKRLDVRIASPLVLHEAPDQNSEELAAILGEGTGGFASSMEGHDVEISTGSDA